MYLTLRWQMQQHSALDGKYNLHTMENFMAVLIHVLVGTLYVQGTILKCVPDMFDTFPNVKCLMLS